MDSKHIDRIAKLGTWPDSLSGFDGHLGSVQTAHKHAGDLLDALTAGISQINADGDLTASGKRTKIRRLGEKTLNGVSALQKPLTESRAQAEKAHKQLLDPGTKTDAERLLSLLTRQEIRSHLQGMPQDARDMAILSAINAGDTPVLDAVASAPGVLKLAQGDQAAAVDAALLQAQNPTGYQGVQSLQKGADVLDRALVNAEAQIRKAADIQMDEFIGVDGNVG